MKEVKLFNCCITGDIFRIATESKVQDFDFSGFKEEEKIVEWIEREGDYYLQTQGFCDIVNFQVDFC